MDDNRTDPYARAAAGAAVAAAADARRQRRMGLDRNTAEGAWLEFASMLDRRKKSHVAVALAAPRGVPAPGAEHR